jgi:2-polyprenyl-3-methyl-5-hydroxy-6-metoxy-1,4-benzoquinol methylase
MKKLTDEEKITQQSYDKLAKQWSSKHVTKSFWKEQMTLFNTLLPKGKILEIGAGGGRDAQELIELGYNYIGTDISGGLIAEARKQNPGADFRKISIYDLNFPEKFDGFWCSAMLLHIPRDRLNEALKAIRKNVRQGGIGFISVKKGYGEKIESDVALKNDKRLFVYWQSNEFKQLLKTQGFEILDESERPMSSQTTWLIYIVRCI